LIGQRHEISIPKRRGLFTYADLCGDVGNIGMQDHFPVFPTIFLICRFNLVGNFTQIGDDVTGEKFVAMVRFYTIGIFNHSPHPFRPAPISKHNPLQRVAYLLFKGVITPLIWVSGLLYLSYNAWAALGLDGVELGTVAVIHIAAAYLLLAFLIAHLYLITTGHTVFTQIKTMITGWEEVEAGEED